MATEHAANLLNDLPRFSPWPARLIGVENFQRSARTNAENQREYNDDKWRLALDNYLASPVKKTCFELLDEDLENQSELVVCRDGSLCKMTAGACYDTHLSLLAERIAPLLPAPALVDLGAGTGRILFGLAARIAMKGTQLIAAEFTRNGRELISAVADYSKLNVSVLACDFSNPEPLQGSIPPDAILFTSMAVVCVPQLREQFVTALLRYRPRAVIHFEPIAQHCDVGTLLGLMQLRYLQTNDYNTDLLPLLTSAMANRRLTVTDERHQLLGYNPFLTGSVIQWRPC